MITSVGSGTRRELSPRAYSERQTLSCDRFSHAPLPATFTENLLYTDSARYLQPVHETQTLFCLDSREKLPTYYISLSVSMEPPLPPHPGG